MISRPGPKRGEAEQPSLTGAVVIGDAGLSSAKADSPTEIGPLEVGLRQVGPWEVGPPKIPPSILISLTKFLAASGGRIPPRQRFVARPLGLSVFCLAGSPMISLRSTL